MELNLPSFGYFSLSGTHMSSKTIVTGLVHYFGTGRQEAGPGMVLLKRLYLTAVPISCAEGTLCEFAELGHTTKLYVEGQVTSLLRVRQEDARKVWESWARRQISPAQDVKDMTCPAINFQSQTLPGFRGCFMSV